MAVQFCGTCGQPLIPDQLFCQHCGSRVDENATRSAPPGPPGITISSPGTLYCGECGALVGSQDRVCRRCGAPVEPTSDGASDPSLSDLPTRMGPPQPPLHIQPASQVSPVFQAPPSYPAAVAAERPQNPAPDYVNQPPSAWGASYSPAPYDESPTYTFGGARPGIQTPPGPGGPPTRQGPRWPLVVALVLVAIALIAGGGIFLLLQHSGTNPQVNGSTSTTTSGITPTTGVTVTPSPTAVVLDTDTATALVQQFYADINAKQYNDAYDLLSTEWQQQQARQDFIDGYKNTVKDTLIINSAEQGPNGSIQVDVHLQAQNTDSIVNYAGYYLVTIENEKLVMLKGDLKQQ